jgi:hypothetical protein
MNANSFDLFVLSLFIVKLLMTESYSR